MGQLDDIQDERERIKNKCVYGLYVTDRQLISISVGIKLTVILFIIWGCFITSMKFFGG